MQCMHSTVYVCISFLQVSLHSCKFYFELLLVPPIDQMLITSPHCPQRGPQISCFPFHPSVWSCERQQKPLPSRAFFNYFTNLMKTQSDSLSTTLSSLWLLETELRDVRCFSDNRAGGPARVLSTAMRRYGAHKQFVGIILLCELNKFD